MSGADPAGAVPSSSRTAVSATRQIARGWRWYHFYFLLALFDLVVISASLFLYHRTVTSYEGALDEFTRIDQKHRWIARLRSGVIQLNAPGNNVFETRNPARERGRFEQRRRHIEHLLGDEADMQIDLYAFRGHVNGMVSEERTIFDIFDTLIGSDLSARGEQEALDRAATSMAAMDRFQADAITSLHRSEQDLLDNQKYLLNSYGRDLVRSNKVEIALFGTVVLMLIGVFWYGRKLQRTHDQMLAEQQLNIEQRYHRLAAVGEVCASVAHGIRNPLAAITSSAQLASEFGTLDAATKLRIEDILGESHRLDQRITRLLDFSRPPAESFDDFDLVPVVQQALGELQPALDQKMIRVSTDFEERNLRVFGDHEILTQSVVEVLSNAMEHAPYGGNISVICRRESATPGRARISVIDDGPGIKACIHECIFDLFFTTKAEGHGIGLASVRKAVEMHGGSVRVVPSDRRGAHVELSLPFLS